MACTYELDGHRFNSETELDDFLLTKYPLKAKLGDAVFSENSHVLNSMSLLNDITEDCNRLTAWKNRKRVWDEDSKSYIYKAPYIGVNAFLA
jgi:hypothetical protein